MQDIVILVAESEDTEKARSTTKLENGIAELATRWSRLVEWVHLHYAQLQNALLRWRHFDEEAEVLGDWLKLLEKEARSVEADQSRKKTDPRIKTDVPTRRIVCETASELADAEMENAMEIQATQKAITDAVIVS